MTNSTNQTGVLADDDSRLIAARIDRIPPGRFHIKLAAILGGGTFFDGFDAVSLAVVLPLVLATFQIGYAEAGLILSAGYLGQWLGAIIVGALSDRVGRKRTFVISLIVIGVLAIACAFAWDATSLLVFRLIQGIGLGAEVPIAATLFNEYMGKRSRGRMGLIYMSAFSWGIFLAPLIALIWTQLFAPDIAWRVQFAFGALILLIALWAQIALPESARWLAERGRGSAADAIVGRMESDAERAGTPLGEVVVAAPATGRAGSTGGRLAELFGAQYRKRALAVFAIWFMTYFVTYGYSAWLPTLYVSVGGLAPSQSLVLTLILGATVLIVTYISAWLVERLGRKLLMIAAFVVALIGAGYGALMIGVVGNTSWQVLFTSGLTIAVGITVPAGVLYVYTPELFPTRIRGWATSASSSFARAASILSPLLFGFLLAGAGGPALVFASLAIAAAVGLIAVAAWGIETRNRALEELAR